MMGSELVKWVKSHKIDAHIITFVAKMPYIDSIKLLEAGAKGCVWKTSHPAKLNRAIDSISNGYTYFDSVHMDCEKISSRYSSDNQLKNHEMIKILQLDYIQIIKLEPGSYKSSGLAKTELFISKECVSNIFSTK